MRKNLKRLPRVTPEGVRRLVYQHLQAIDSPRSLSIYLIMRATDEDPECFDDEIASLPCDPNWFCTAKAFSEFYEPTELVRKWSGLKVSWDPEEAAWKKFQEAEQQCSATNHRLRNGQMPLDLNPEYSGRIKRHLQGLLGKVTSELLSSCVSEGGWGKGVTSSCKGRWLSEYHKLAAKPQATRTFAELARCINSDVSPLLDQEIDVVNGSTLAFVPKDARSHRSIAVEPSMNMYLQKGIGLAIRRRLRKRWALNLHSQERNQELARLGAIDASYATIDLSSASDTVSYALVEELLPDDWVRLLKACRCTFTEYEGKEIFLNKWSSMGNGYTFELETAIFAAIVRAVISPDDWYAGRWAVYGDDIIVPNQYFEELCKLLAYYGFTLNMKKTFSKSPFRESCGADFFLGEPVRPFYLKGVEWIDLMNWANWLSSHKHDSATRRTWDAISWYLGPSFPRVPSGSHGVLGLHVDEMTYNGGNVSKVIRKGILGYIVSGVSWQAHTIRSSQIDGPYAVVAHLRLLTARSPTALSEPWLLAATKTGKWVHTRSICKDWPALPLFL